jgi:hypothetical protein
MDRIMEQLIKSIQMVIDSGNPDDCNPLEVKIDLFAYDKLADTLTQFKRYKSNQILNA